MREEEVEANNVTVDTFSPQRENSNNSDNSKKLINAVANMTINDVRNDLVDKVGNLTINNVGKI